MGGIAVRSIRTSGTEERWSRVSPLEGVPVTGWDVRGPKFRIVGFGADLGRGVSRCHLGRGGGLEVPPREGPEGRS